MCNWINKSLDSCQVYDFRARHGSGRVAQAIAANSVIIVENHRTVCHALSARSVQQTTRGVETLYDSEKCFGLIKFTNNSHVLAHFPHTPPTVCCEFPKIHADATDAEPAFLRFLPSFQGNISPRFESFSGGRRWHRAPTAFVLRSSKEFRDGEEVSKSRE